MYTDNCMSSYMTYLKSGWPLKAWATEWGGVDHTSWALFKCQKEKYNRQKVMEKPK